MEKYFKVLLPGAKIYIPNNGDFNRLGHRIIDLSEVPYNAKSLYITGFKHLALLPAATEWLKNFPESTLKKLIEQKKIEYSEDVPILEKALELKKQEVTGVNTDKTQKSKKVMFEN